MSETNLASLSVYPPGCRGIQLGRLRSKWTDEQESSPAPTAVPWRSWTDRWAHQSGRRAGWCPSCKASDPCSGSSVAPGEKDRGTCMLSFKRVPSPEWPFLRDQLVDQPRTTCWVPQFLPTVVFYPPRPSEIKPSV